MRVCVVKAALAVAATASTLLLPAAFADQSPNPHYYKVPCNQNDDDDAFCEERLKGSSEYSWREDRTGHTIITNDEGEEVYADLDVDGKRLVPTDCPVKGCNPEKRGLEAHLKDDAEEIFIKCGNACHRSRNEPLHPLIKKAKDERRRRKREADENGEEVEALRQLELTKQKGVMYNLVLLMKFADHADRTLPSEEDFDHLFNDEGGHPVLAPGGSVKDCFTYNSYGMFSMESIIVPWCQLSKTESYYGDGYYGMTGRLEEAISHCLDLARDWIDQNDAVDWAIFNRDSEKNNLMDAIAVIHSGYGAEWGEPDCQTGNDYQNRIWSHKWEFLNPWRGTADGTTMEVNMYHISPGLWGTCEANIGRIGVICHETGHFLGLPDLYDGTGGSGVGTHCLMGNSWGWDGSQHCPPAMSAWAKNHMGWLDIQALSRSGNYHLAASHFSNVVFTVSNPSNQYEYFLIENKQRSYKFDNCLPEEGLVIWHIDEETGYNEEGFPGQPGWPENGDHYRVALVSADGLYNLEKGSDLGMPSNFFHGGVNEFGSAGGINEFGSAGVGRSGRVTSKFPNTDWYSRGKVIKSGFSIQNISPPMHQMSFTFVQEGGGIVGKDTNPRTDYLKVGKEDIKSNSCFGKKEDCTEDPSNCCPQLKLKCKFSRKKQRKLCVPLKKKKKRRKNIKRNLRHNLKP